MGYGYSQIYGNISIRWTINVILVVLIEQLGFQNGIRSELCISFWF